jgi:2-iminobutanoate/2-iminopropanoate deaminase
MRDGAALGKSKRREADFALRNCVPSAYSSRSVHGREPTETAMVEIQSFCAPGVFDPPSYSQGTRVTGGQTMLFLSGQIAYDEKGGVLHPGDFKVQAREVLTAIKRLIESQGGTLNNIVKLSTFLTDINNRAELIPIRSEFFGGKLPASTLFEVSALVHPDWLIEIEAIAVL